MIARDRGVGALGVYVDGFLARCDVLARPGQARLDQPGLHGVFSSDDPSATRLVVDNDQAIEVLSTLLARTSGGMVNVLATAPRVTRLLESDERWRGAAATAMVKRDLRTLSPASLPSDLAVRSVGRAGGDAPTDAALIEAVNLAVRVDTTNDSSTTTSLLAHLRAMPPTVRLFAAVDDDDSVIGTAGVGVYGRHAHLILINTDLGRRGEGIGRAMTSLAITDARARGATAACLDASDEGRNLYETLGFEAAAALTRFTSPA